MELQFEERVVIVTGGSRGIGLAAANAFARERARVVVTYANDQSQAERALTELRRSGAEAAAARFDLSAPASIAEASRLAMQRWGRIDVLVNNAVDWGPPGLWSEAFESVDAATWRAAVAANLGGHHAAIQSVLPAMRARGWGRIVNVSSTIAVDGMAGAGAYAAAKGGLHGLTRTLAVELGPIGVLANVVMPGLTLTEANLTRLSPEEREQYASRAATRRLLNPDDVVPIIVFLASAANTAVTGEVIRASGG